MSRIRKLYFFDKKKVGEMISFLSNSANETYINHIMFSPFVLLHYFVPLRFKFLPESYILKEKPNVKGLITVAPTKNPIKQMEIQKLFFEENCFSDAAELIQYVVAKYKALGTASFVIRTDDYLPELLKLLITKCGFSQISYEKLWEIKNADINNFDSKLFRVFRNSDAAVVSSLYNESLLPHIRPLLGVEPKEFKESLFKGLSYYTEYKYVAEDKKTKNISAYISIQTIDNFNYTVDIVASSWANINIDEIISFAATQVSKRKMDFNLFVKTKKYTQTGSQYENLFKEKKFDCVRNQIVLTNSSAKIIKDTEKSGKFTVLNKFYTGAGINIGGVSNKI